jgi:hypothetical protein
VPLGAPQTAFRARVRCDRSVVALGFVGGPGSGALGLAKIKSMTMRSQPTESALLIPVPAAEPTVQRWRERLDPACRLGVPAHVTLLYPFVAPGRSITRQLNVSLICSRSEQHSRSVSDNSDDSETKWPTLRPSPARPSERSRKPSVTSSRRIRPTEANTATSYLISRSAKKLRSVRYEKRRSTWPLTFRSRPTLTRYG